MQDYIVDISKVGEGPLQVAPLIGVSRATLQAKFAIWYIEKRPP